jgi:octaprenyl-diphosphate synthase
LEIIFGKTAVLFSAACECGALVNNRPEEEVSRLSAFGKNLGIVFQIVDDVLDYSSKADVLGKNVGDDFFEGKVTLPIILTYEKSNSDEKKLIEKIFADNFGSDKKNQDHFDKIISLITKYNGLQSSKNLALSHKEAAINSLEIFPNSSAKDALISVLNHSFLRIS